MALVLSGWCNGQIVGQTGGKEGLALLVWCYGKSRVGYCNGLGSGISSLGRLPGVGWRGVQRESASRVVSSMDNGIPVMYVVEGREQRAAEAIEPWSSLVL